MKIRLYEPKFFELLYLFFLLLFSGFPPFPFFKVKYFVAKNNGKIVGGIGVSNYNSYYGIGQFVVKRSERRRGIGSDVLKQILNSRNKEVYLNCYIGMKKFYEKFGFSEVKENNLPIKMRKRFKFYRFLAMLINKNLIYMKRKSYSKTL